MKVIHAALISLGPTELVGCSRETWEDLMPWLQPTVGRFAATLREVTSSGKWEIMPRHANSKDPAFRKHRPKFKSADRCVKKAAAVTILIGFMELAI